MVTLVLTYLTLVVGELAPSASVQVGGWRLEVLEVDRRAITRLRLVPLTDPTRDAGP